jgi:hypothetical protein
VPEGTVGRTGEFPVAVPLDAPPPRVAPVAFERGALVRDERGVRLAREGDD